MSNNRINDRDENEIFVDIESNTDKKNQPSGKETKKTFLNNSNLLMNCLKSDNYCFSLMDYFKKMFKFSQIDFYSSYLQILYCFTPKKLNDLAKIRKQLKNQWARDDPGFLLLIIITILFFNLLYSLLLKKFNLYHIIQIFFFQGFFCLIILGIFVGFLFKYLIEKYLKNQEANFSKGQSLETLYSFDIHCNSFVPFYFFTNMVQLILLPIILNENIFSTLLANSLYLMGLLYYFYVSLLCYYCIPFIKKNKYIPLAIWPLIAIFALLTLLNFNISKFTLGMMFDLNFNSGNPTEILEDMGKIVSAVEVGN